MKHHHVPIVFALLLALGLALLFTAPVFADDAPPPEQPAAPEAAAPPAPEGGGESGGEAEAPAEALTSGAPAPLAIAGGDLGILGPPWVFYFVGSTPYDFDTPQDAIDNIQDTGILPSNRYIYLEQGTFDGFTIDGTELTYLTQKGVLKQLKGVLGNATYAYPPAANFTGYNNENASVIDSGGVEVHHTTAGFLLQGLYVIGGDVYFHDNSGTLTIQSLDVGNGCEMRVEGHNGAISADSLSVYGAGGAILDNTASASAGVTIYNGKFWFNSNVGGNAMGLEIYTRGLAKLSGIDIFQNQTTGLYIEALKGIELTNAYSAENGSHGVEIKSAGIAKVTVKNLETLNNGDDGIRINTLGDISLTQVGAGFNGQNDDGMGVSGFGINIGTWPMTPGGRNLVGKDLQAWNNHDTGLDLKVSGTTMLSGIYTANNWGTGTWVYSSGAITLNGVTSDHDGAVGIHLVNLAAATPQPITILNSYGVNDVNNAYGDYFGSPFGPYPGVLISSKGAVSITGLSTHNNVFGGMQIGDPTELAGAVTLTDTGAGSNGEFGMLVLSKGKISMKHGWAGGNTFYGAQLDNTSAPTPQAVTIENGWFYGNGGGNGLEVQSKGAVTLKNVNAGDNHAYGIYIFNDTGTANVSVSGTSATNQLDIARNGEAGLYIRSSGAVTLAFIGAYENGWVFSTDGQGINVNNTSSLTPKTLTMTNIEVWNNEGTGMIAAAKGLITLTNTGARDNKGAGVILENTVSGGVKVLRTAYWHNDFGRNGREGLWVNALGPVTLARINAYENGWQGDYDGVHVDNCIDTGGDTCTGKWGVTLQITAGWNHDFSRNSQHGLYISSGGAVKMANVNAGENGGYGLVVDTNHYNASGAVTLNTVGDVQNNFWRNGLDGVRIAASGAIIVSNFNANENGRHGLNLGYHAALTSVPITVTNGNANDNRNGHGIYVRSLGNIKVVDVDAQNNDVHYTSIAFDTTVPEKLQGWLYDWDADSWGDGDVYEFEVDEVGGTKSVEVHAALEFQGVVTLEVWDDVNEEWDFVVECNDVTECTISNASLPNGLYRARITGIDWDNQGNYLISLNDDDTGYTSFDYIGGAGLWLNNDYAGSTGTVTVANGPNRGYVNTHNNGSSGTYIRSRKAISITSLHSNNNGGLGLDADNCMYNGSVCLYVAPVTINGYHNNWGDNQMGGIWMSSEGVVYLQNVDANNNHRGDGAHIFAGNLTIKATNPGWYSGFSNNGGTGLWLFSNGTVTLDRVYSNNNGGQGMWLSNTVATTPKAVSISNAYFNDNQDASLDTAGLEVWSKGAVTLKSVEVSNNASGGAYIDNSAGSLGITVQQSKFNNNQAGSGAYSELWDGIHIVTNGNVLWNSSSANGNGGGDGAELNAGGSVTVLATYGNNDFSFNSQSGLGLIGIASANINGVRGGGNGNRGLIIATNTAGAITVNNSLFIGNGKQGVLIINDGTGLIKLSYISGFQNAMHTTDGDLNPPHEGDFAAAEIYTGGGVVSIINSAFHHNGDWGIYVDLNGGILLPMTGTTWNSNNFDGAGVDGTDNPNVEVVP